MFFTLKSDKLSLFFQHFFLMSLTAVVATDAFAASQSEMDSRLKTLEAMVPRVESLSADCRNDRSCGEKPVCEGRTHILRDLANLGPVLDQYIQTLNAEDAALSRSIDDAIANSDYNAAALEGARIASSLTHTTDELLGAVSEVNGMASFILSPDLTNQDAVWEFLKDANSLVNRIADATYGIDQHIESVRYIDIPDDQKHKLTDLKADFETAFIAWSGDQLGTGKDVQVLLDKQKSNLTDVIGTIRTVMAEAKKMQFAGETLNEVATYRANVLKNTPQHLRASVKRSLDAAQATAVELGKESQTDANRAIGFAAAQITARLVQTYYSTKWLEHFRNKVQHLRGLAARSGDKHLALIEERDLVRERARQAGQLRDRLHSLAGDLRQCAFQSCRENLAALDLLQLPEIPSRNGNLMYGKAQERLASTLAALTKSLSGNLSGGGGINPVFSQGEKTETADVSGGGLEALCPKCGNLAGEAAALSAKIAFAEARRDALEVRGNELAELKLARQSALKDAEDLQARYNRQNSSGLFGSWAKVTEDHQTDLSELGSQIRRLTTKVRTLGDEIGRIEDVHDTFDELDHQIAQDRQKFNDVLTRLDDCNLNMCNAQGSADEPGTDAQSAASSNSHDDCPEPEANQSAKTEVINVNVTVGSDLEITNHTPGDATSGSTSDTGTPAIGEDEEYVLVKVTEPVTIPYWCAKEGSDGKLVRCKLQVSSTVVECWVPKSVAAKGVKSCTEAKKIYKSRNGG